MNRDAFGTLFRNFGYSMDVPPEPEKACMGCSLKVPPEQRRGNFQEITLGYSGEQALMEAARCLRCDIRADARSPWR